MQFSLLPLISILLILPMQPFANDSLTESQTKKPYSGLETLRKQGKKVLHAIFAGGQRTDAQTIVSGLLYDGKTHFKIDRSFEHAPHQSYRQSDDGTIIHGLSCIHPFTARVTYKDLVKVITGENNEITESIEPKIKPAK